MKTDWRMDAARSMDEIRALKAARQLIGLDALVWQMAGTAGEFGPLRVGLREPSWSETLGYGETWEAAIGMALQRLKLRRAHAAEWLHGQRVGAQ